MNRRRSVSRLLAPFVLLLIMALLVGHNASYAESTLRPTKQPPLQAAGGWSAPQSIATVANPIYPYSASIAASEDGAWHIVYKEHICTGPNGQLPCGSYIRYKNSTGSTETILQGNRPAECQGNIIDSPALTIDKNGKLHLVYHERTLSESCVQTTTSIRYINNVSGSWSAPQTLSSRTEENPLLDPVPQIAVSPDGVAHIVYYDKVCVADGFKCEYYLYYKNTNGDAKTLSYSKTSNTCPVSFFNLPSIVSDANGKLYISYHIINRDCSYKEVTSIYSINNIAGSWSTAQPILSAPGRALSTAKLAVSADGTWHLAYNEFVCVGEEMPCTSYIRYRNSDGYSATLAKAEQTANCEGQNMSNPAIALGPDGKIHIVYSTATYSGTCEKPAVSIDYVSTMLKNVELPWHMMLPFIGKSS